MLRVLSSPKKLCDGMTRRDLLHIGGMGMFGLGLNQLLEAQSTQAATSHGELASSFGKAKRCIILFLYGSPSQLETYDMKPNAPDGIRGIMNPIATSLPGLDICEHMPNMSKIMDRTTVVRSVTHPNPIHGVAYAMTGVPAVDVTMELSRYDPQHHPWFGSVVEYLDRQKRNGLPSDFVQNVSLPFPFSSQRTDQPFRAGPYGAFLGGAYHPIWTEFMGEGTVPLKKARTGFSWEGKEPYLGCTPESYFRFSATDPLPGVSIDRLDRRRSLLDQFEESRKFLDKTVSGKSLTNFQKMAYSMVSSSKVADALDVRKESAETRDLYGMTLFGQASLAARRLVEAGTKLVSVFWDEYGLAGDAWDTHANHFPRLKDQLLPPFERAFSGLILDLERRGMLDDTLVCVMSEHGRTPKIDNKSEGAGRHHWSRAYSSLFAGGGIARGNVVGATDSQAGDVKDRPVSPKSLLATMYHLLGIDPHRTIPDRTNRRIPLVPEDSEVIREMLA